MFKAESLTTLAAAALILAACAPTPDSVPPAVATPRVQSTAGDLELGSGSRAELGQDAASATGICQSYVGQTVTPTPFEAFAGGPPKGEFETSEQYAARQGAAFGSSAGPMIIEKEPEDRQYFEYDADTQTLRVISYALHNTNIAYRSAFESAGQDIPTDIVDLSIQWSFPRMTRLREAVRPPMPTALQSR